jgi:carbon starvation protein CstA
MLVFDFWRHVQGFPTLVIVDRCGVVRGFHVGYSPHLAEDVIQAVERLLGE